MSSSDVTVSIALSAVALLGIGLWFVVFKPWYAQRATLIELRQQFAGTRILALSSNALFNGLDRSWDTRWRGRGVLVLTRHVLYFRQWQRTQDLTVPMSRIESVGIGPEGYKTRRRRKQLQVSYRGIDDQLRVATWVLEKPQQWAKLISDFGMKKPEQIERHAGDNGKT